jgi:hypothetical protein
MKIFFCFIGFIIGMPGSWPSDEQPTNSERKEKSLSFYLIDKYFMTTMARQQRNLVVNVWLIAVWFTAVLLSVSVRWRRSSIINIPLKCKFPSFVRRQANFPRIRLQIISQHSTPVQDKESKSNLSKSFAATERWLEWKQFAQKTLIGLNIFSRLSSFCFDSFD